MAALTLAPALALTGRDAFADGAPPPCDDATHAFEAPVHLSFEEADFRAPFALCPTMGLGVRGHGGAIIAVGDFYGALDAGALFGARWALPKNIGLSFAMDLVRWRFVQNATISRTVLGTGQATIGATFGSLGFERRGARFVPGLRVILPTSSTFHSARTVGIDPTLSWGTRVRTFDVFGSFGYAVWGTISRGGFNLWHGPSATAGTALTIKKRFSILLQADLHGVANHGAFDIERLALSAALRLRLGRALRLELAAGRAFYGADRTDGAFALSIAYDNH